MLFAWRDPYDCLSPALELVGRATAAGISLTNGKLCITQCEECGGFERAK